MKRILGIDPGLQFLGYAVIAYEKPTIEVLNMGTMMLTKVENTLIEKLNHIYKRILTMIEEYKIEELAIEAPIYSKNMQIAIQMGRVQGVCIAAALHADLKVTEYAPKEVKKAITGHGNAPKEQVALMLEKILHKPLQPDTLDASDALATAVCHANQPINPSLAKKRQSWKQFIIQNPHKIKK